MMKKRWRYAPLALLAAGLLLALDLANHGLAWQVFWSQTGEEEPLAQLRAMVEWAGNLTRPQPRTEPLMPVKHTHFNPYGINVFLQEEAEPQKRERILQMVSEAGFQWVRQQFPWEDIEIHERGDFKDRRNDLDGDGEPDAVSAWDKYDHIVGLVEQYDLDMLVRLDNPPSWAHSDPAIGPFAPPDDPQDFANYVTAVAERYQGRLHYYQVWNEPNIYPEWGEQFVDPEGYTDLLCRAYAALKAVDPEIVVISGAIAPTISLDGMNLQDVVYLQLMYDAGAGGCFDVLAVQGYGLNSGPTDRRMRITTVNYGRNQYIRDVMIANGDSHKSIWITEAAWNPQPEDPDTVPVLYGAYGIVSEDEAARYMPLAYQRAQAEWPWVGPVFYWFFKRPHDFERSQSWYYFRMVEPDFTPLPVYTAMKDYITTQEPVLYPGVHQAEHWALTLPDSAQLVPADGAQFGTAMRTNAIGFTIHSNHDLLMRWRPVEGQPLPDGDPINTYMDAEGWSVTRYPASEPFPLGHLVLTRLGDETTTLLVDSLTVIDNTYANLFPLLAGVGIFMTLLLWVILSALWARRQQ